jgi:signal transduction histidine kinase
MRKFSLWPQSLFGRLIAASIVALLVGQIVGVVLIARERERFILQGSVREWSRRIAEVTSMLQGVDNTERAAIVTRLTARPWRFGHHPSDVIIFRDGLIPPSDMDWGPPHPPGAEGPVPPGAKEDMAPPGGERLGPPPHRWAEQAATVPSERGPRPVEGGVRLGPPRSGDDSRSLLFRATTSQVTLPLPFTKVGYFEEEFEQQLRATLGGGFEVHVTPTADPSKKAISIWGPLFTESRDGTELYDASVKFPDGYTTLFRVTRFARGAPLPRGLFANLGLLVIVMSIVLFVVARSITRPLSELARAADSVGRDLRQPKIAERGARELRNAARAFNTMQDRMQRYLDSRSRVLAAMSHDLKTPLTRLRLQVEMLDDSAAQARIGKQLDEMESMVHGALALFRGLDDNEAFTPLDVNEMLATLQAEFAEMSASVSVEGRAARPILGKPQALRRCLTNLLANAVKFGSQAWVLVEDGPALVIRVRDDGPGIPEDQLERVFEPFYRVESSRNRDTGGTGLGLSIARDVIQAHGGSLVLTNLPVRGLEATVTLPRT